MPVVKLHARNVGTLEPRLGRAQDYWWDGTESAPPGFGVRVSARGRTGETVRTYVLAYRIHGRKRFLKLGRVGGDQGGGLADARDRARDELGKVQGGKDPQARKQELRTASNVADLVGEFIVAGEGTKAVKTQKEYRVLLNAEIADADFGRVSIGEAERGDAKRFLEAIAKRAPVQANRVYQLVRAAFAWGINEGLTETNPCAGLGRPRKEESRERVLTDVELRIVWAAMDSLGEGGVRRVPLITASAVRLLILLGTRRGETLRMRWQDVDLGAREWRIPGVFRKGGQPLTVPLSAPARAILHDLSGGAKTPSEGWVFGGPRGGSIAAVPGRVGAAVRAAVGATAGKAGAKVEKFTLHDLRRTCATGCGELGAPPHVVALILGHKGLPGAGKVTPVYDRSRRVREVAPWLASWGEHVVRIVSDEERHATVVAIGGRA
jgi:integrase